MAYPGGGPVHRNEEDKISLCLRGCTKIRHIRDLQFVAKPTDTQKPLLLTNGKCNGDHLRLTRQQHRFEAHDCMFLSVTVLCDHSVERGHDVPAVGLTHPVRDRRSVGISFGLDSPALQH